MSQLRRNRVCCRQFIAGDGDADISDKDFDANRHCVYCGDGEYDIVEIEQE